MPLLTRFLVLMLVAGDFSAHAEARELFEPKALTPEEQAVVDAAPLGSKLNPVRCESPEGERVYLNRLRCPSGRPAKFKRGGSVGEGPYETVMDVYEVRCAEWPDTVSVYMDMYHEGYAEQRPVPRFSITAAK